MSHLLGLDLGTSSLKAVVASDKGKIVGLGQGEYPIDTPEPGAAEQDPALWWKAAVVATRQALVQANFPEVSAIGLSGQMHGAVLLGHDDEPGRPAIIWADQRSASVLDRVEERIGRAELGRVCGTAPAAGFQVATLVWLQEQAPESLERTKTVVLPKDYLRYRLTGSVETDPSDASATGMFDVARRRWPESILGRLGIDSAILPPIRASTEVCGPLRADAAHALGLRPGIPVATGCADQPAQAIGNGLLDPPLGSITLGTGGQVFMPLKEPAFDPALRLHTFCHAQPDRWYFLGAMLAAGMALRWFKQRTGNLDYATLDGLADAVEPGSEGLRFLPYLVGERSPLMDPRAKGAFVGLTLRHDLGHLTRAVLEGIAFSIRHIVEVMEEAGARPERFIASGNGLGSRVWRQMLADALNRPLYRSPDRFAPERAGMGAALLAGIAAGILDPVSSITALAPRFDEETRPDPARAERYNDAYVDFRSLYPRLHPYFHGNTVDRQRPAQ
ncbi:MAG: xylulokinase [Verrucomicrobia bacterium]|nr:xylulokinase [Verrucomicrobiota bacterium]